MQIFNNVNKYLNLFGANLVPLVYYRKPFFHIVFSCWNRQTKKIVYNVSFNRIYVMFNDL